MIQKGKCGVFNPLLIECLMDIESYIQNDLKINEFYEDNEYFEERTQEHLKDEGLNLSNLLYQDLYFEKSKYKFYNYLIIFNLNIQLYHHYLHYLKKMHYY